ncbi:hypothetical protein HMI54_013902 [Coelomomyces lativittatus]|nr:hypothetical protein HMI54_013902 [Coelomomyces lativittatus]KAJ1512713.1 hypothetical protein HMI56_003663 [Coelomomyces lativittatus]
MDKVVEILITNVEGDAFEIKDLMVSNDICYEPEDPSLPNFLPVKVRANFTRSPLANRTIVFSNANKKAEVVKRAILTHIEL